MKFSIGKRGLLFTGLLAVGVVPLSLVLATGFVCAPQAFALLPDMAIARFTRWLSSTTGLSFEQSVRLALGVPIVLSVIGLALLRKR